MVEVQEQRPTEGQSLPPDQIFAIRITRQISKLITGERHDVQSVLIARRLRREKIRDIAEAEKEILERLGACTFALRWAVVQKVCADSLSPELTAQIVSEIQSSRPRREPTAKVLEILKKGQNWGIHEWDEKTDALLLRLADEVVREQAPKKGYSDWKKIAEIMKHDHQIELTAEQWKGHVLYLRKKSRDESKNIDVTEEKPL